jgi:myo-inositol-1(or 4)-monophosphatase
MTTAPHFDLQKVKTWVKEAGNIALSYYQTQLSPEHKDDLTPVTAADHAVEKFLINNIEQHYGPMGHAIIGEESGGLGQQSEFVWAIDPIDGTRIFINGLPLWCISVGLLRNGQAYRGVVYLPVLNEIYYTDNHGVPFWNDRPLEGMMRTNWDRDSFICLAAESHRYFDIDFERVRALGAAVAHQVYVARGTAVAALQRRLSLWDMAGPQAILTNVGAEAVYLDGAAVAMPDVLLEGKVRGPVLFGHPQIIEKLLPRIKLRSNETEKVNV